MKKYQSKVSCIVFIFIIITNAYPEEFTIIEPSQAENKIISEIQLKGHWRTLPYVIKRELIIKQNSPLIIYELNESMQRLKNLRLFRIVKPILVPQPDNKVKVIIELEEKWTILPFARAGGGGGTNFLIVGIYDINIFGTYTELGGQYENLNGSHSGVIWFRDPRFLDYRLLVGIDLWKINRIRDLYNRDGEHRGAYLMQRTKGNLFFNKEISNFFKCGMGLEVLDDNFKFKDLTIEQKKANLRNNIELPGNGKSIIVRLTAEIGKLNYDNYLVEGSKITAVYEQAGKVWNFDYNFYKIKIEGIYFKRLPLKSNFGIRFSVGDTNANAEQHLFYIGGLEYKRGFRDGQFINKKFWESNLEFRIPSVDTKWIVLQHNLFYDAGSIADKWTTMSEHGLCMSAGAGIRIISPKIARFVIRLDYAYTISANNQHGISFGVQQFF